MSTNKIVPRWEWRCFAPSLATIAQAVAIPSDAASRESDEIYVLDPRGTENAKIREGVLDIKRLRQIDADGLELWEPVFKARFPLSRSDLAAASAVWPPPLETVRRETYTIEQFIEEVISLRADLRVVRVHKSRRAFTFAGCIAELVRLAVECRTLESFSLQHEDPTCTALLTLGLDGHANTNYSLGLRRALGVKRATTDQQEGSRHGYCREIERKFLVNTVLWRAMAAGMPYRQGYLSSVNERVVRVRIAGDRGFLTIKGLTTGVNWLEFEYPIPLADATVMLDQLCERPLIEKTRHREVFAGWTWEIDVFQGDNDGLVVAEVEIANPEDKVELPRWAGAEVSNDPRYFNNNLAAHPYRYWRNDHA